MRDDKFFPFLLLMLIAGFFTCATATSPALYAQGQAHVITQKLGGPKEVSPWMDISAAKAIAEEMAESQATMISVWLQPRHFWLNPFPARKEPYVICRRGVDASNYNPKRRTIKH